MKKQLLLTLFLGFGLLAIAQDKNAKKYADLITAEDAKKHLSILASDEYEGRETGKPGAEKAAQYLKTQFKSLGLKGPVKGDYFQKIELNEKTVIARNVSLNGKLLGPGNFILSNYIGSKITFKDFVFIGYGIQSAKYDDLSGVNLEGKVVVVLPGEPVVNGISKVTGTSTLSDWSSGRTPKKLPALREKKPALIITVADYIPNTAASGRPSLVLGKEKPQINAITLSAEVVNQLIASTGKRVEEIKKSILETGKSAPLSFSSSLEIDVQAQYTSIPAKNVLGFMEGSDAKLKKEVLVFSAHYDHIGLLTTPDASDKINNGADDDGSGTTGILEIAKAFAKAKKDKRGPRRSILFLAVVGEEKGLLGSEWYSDNPVFPLKNTIADLNIDMIGRVGDEYRYVSKEQPGKADSLNYVYVIGSAMLSSTLRQVSEKANTTYTKLTLDYKYDDPADPNRFYYRSDHYNFAKHNIPIIFYFNGVHPDYHKPSDEVSKINFPLLAKRAQLVFYTGWDLANRAERPLVDVKNPMPSNR